MDRFFAHIPDTSHPRELIECTRYTDMRVESAARRRHQINRNRVRILRVSSVEVMYPLLRLLEQSRIKRPVV